MNNSELTSLTSIVDETLNKSPEGFRNDDEESFEVSSCEFGDDECGEPLSAQRIVLDFTPIDSIDTEDVQLKCCAFWDFVKSHSELSELIAKPNENSSKKGLTSITSDIIDSIKDNIITMSFEMKEKTVVSTLRIFEDKDIVRGAFETKQQISCIEEIKDYFNEPNVVNRLPNNAEIAKNNLKKENQDKKKRNSSSIKTRQMCQSLTEWDIKHPKCLSPPGPVLSLEDPLSNSM